MNPKVLAFLDAELEEELEKARHGLSNKSKDEGKVRVIEIVSAISQYRTADALDRIANSLERGIVTL